MVMAEYDYGAVLPYSVFLMPLTLWRVTLILMNIVNTVPGSERFTEYE
jgi:hypothetical protein